MEKINYRFLNYKRYDKFLEDLNDNKVREDAIVFVQDNLRIWARGKEYVCNGVNNSTLSEGVLTFKDALNNDVFKLTIHQNTFSITDTEGNTYSTEVVLKDDMESFKTQLSRRLSAIDQNAISLSDRIDQKQDKLVLDSEINEESSNAVENRAIAEALKDYVLNSQLLTALVSKQDNLVLGDGLVFRNGVLEITLDTETFVILDELPDNPNPNKVYMLYRQVDGQPKYYSYRWNGAEWVLLGELIPKVDLSAYAKIADSDEKYTTPYDVTKSILDLYTIINNTFLKKANYALIGYVNQRLEDLLRIVDEKYVLKKDVYIPGRGWSSTDIVPMGDKTVVDVESGGSGSGSGGNNGMVTLTELQYLFLVSVNAVDPFTYYFTYEGEEETTNWTFGGTFPITLGGEGLGILPITLT